MRTTSFLRAFWSLTKPYWVSEQRRKGWLLLATVVGLALLLVWLNVQFNYWNNAFYNTFQDKNQAEFFRQLGRFGLLAAAYIVAYVYRFYFQQMLQIEWRSWMTGRFLQDWLKEQTHYRMALLDRGTDNPDQRIAEDLRYFVEYTLTLALGLLSSVVTLVTFITILWTLSGALTVFGVHIPGYMVWVAVVYAAVGTWLTHAVGRPLIGLNYDQQRYEADFRFSLVRLRENSEGVALYRGEREELEGLHERFGWVIRNWWGLMRKQKQLGWFTSFYGQLAIIFPYIVVSPRFFSGAIPLGGIFQTASAFGQVQDSLSWFINAYTQFATWKATVDRLTGFAASIERVREESRRMDGERVAASTPGIGLEEVSIRRPQGAPLLARSRIELKPRENVLVLGPSGAGKSTFFRTLAGIWPYWSGRVKLPDGKRLLFLPQKPYFPLGSLKHTVSYPEDAEKFSDGEVREALEDVGLDALASDLERRENWGQVLSGGEQQRLAFARALLNRPDWLFLDEATASLPEEAQDALYRLVKERLPDTTLVSVGHRSSLAAHHDRQLAWRGDSISLGAASSAALSG